MGSKARSIGKFGKHYVNLRKREDWGSWSLQSLMMQCWQNKYGGLFMIKIHCFIVFLSHDTFPMAPFFMLNKPQVPWLGKVF